jgi:hypothetical protein
MKKQILISAVLAFVLATCLMWYEFTYDKAYPPYTTAETIEEIVILTPFLTVMFGVIIFFALQGLSYFLKLIPKIRTRS